MSILTVLQAASMTVGLSRPLAVYSSTAREWQEMQVVANEAASVIVEAFDWQRLRKVATIAGTGSAEDFDLPADYGRMLKTARLWSSRDRWSARHIVDSDEWIEMSVAPFVPALGVWTLYGNQIHIRPALSAEETAKFFYLTNQIIAGGKTQFTADTDVFVLGERLLKLAIVYLWKQSKGQDFLAELSDYEMALAQEVEKDGGSKPILSGNIGVREGNIWPGRVSA